MNGLTKVLFIIWIVLAIAAFVSAFFIPLIPKIIGLTFGGFNLLIIGAWIASLREARKEYKRLEKEKEDGLQL